MTMRQQHESNSGDEEIFDEDSQSIQRAPQSSHQNQERQQQNLTYPSSFSKKFFKFVGNTLGMRNILSKAFIYHPPTPTYQFSERKTLEQMDSDFRFQLKKEFLPQHQEIPLHISYDLFKINFRNKQKKTQSIPILHVINKKSKTGQVILYNHGNSSDLGTIFYSLMKISKIYKMNIVAFDYRGYGISKGETNEANTYEDCEILMSFIVQNLKYKIQKIIIWGFSLGSGPAVQLASKYQSIGGLVLEAPLASVYLFLENTVSANYYEEEGDIYANLYKIGKVKCPILLMHGKNDEVIPFKHSQILLQKFQLENPENRKQIQCLLVEDLRHNDIQSLIQIKKSLTATKLMQFFELTLRTEAAKMIEGNEVLSLIQKEQQDLASHNILSLIAYRIFSRGEEV